MNGKRTYLGTFELEEDAALAWDIVARALGRPTTDLNLPNRPPSDASQSAYGVAAALAEISGGPKPQKKEASSAYTGVSWHKQCKKWQAQATVSGTARERDVTSSLCVLTSIDLCRHRWMESKCTSALSS